MRILSIGATRFIGRPALAHLIRFGLQIVAFHRGDRPAPPGIAAELHGDYRNLSEYRQDLQSRSPDFVMHMTIANERQTVDFMDVFRGFAGRALMLSSADVYRAAGSLHGTEPGRACQQSDHGRFAAANSVSPISAGNNPDAAGNIWLG